MHGGCIIFRIRQAWRADGCQIGLHLTHCSLTPHAKCAETVPIFFLHFFSDLGARLPVLHLWHTWASWKSRHYWAAYWVCNIHINMVVPSLLQFDFPITFEDMLI